MNAFHKKALAAAVLSGLGIGSAHAVYQDANGLGQALIYPYYTVQAVDNNTYNTYISVVNTTTLGKVVKVRVREGKNSREVLDFNLWLSPNDVWTAAIIPADATSSSPGRLITADNSCTTPPIPKPAGVDFRNSAYVGDGGPSSLDRTREGYIEMIEMATVTGTTLTAITHGSNGVPASCATVQAAPPPGNLANPTGGLSGTGTLINVNNGSDVGYSAIALANVYGVPKYSNIANEAGTFLDADPVSVVITSSASGTRAYTSGWTGAFARVNAVSSTMMHSNVINEYVLDAATKSNTDWVVTFPTKRYYTDVAPIEPPFTNKFTSIGSCETFDFTYFNREEATFTTGIDFSPLPAGTTASACWESTVLSIRSGQAHNPASTTSGVLGSVNTLPINLAAGFQNGWANVKWTNPAAAVTGISSSALSTTSNITTGAVAPGTQRYTGLPSVGFMVRSFNNGTLTCAGASCQGNYGSAFTHNYLDTITPTP